MSPSRPLFGLTGGIASGKSTVAAMLAERGAIIVDSDRIVRDLQRPGGAALTAIVEEFGEDVLTADGELDRGALGSLVFGDEEARSRLNAVVHPLVRSEAARRIAEAPAGAVVVQDIPLLVETGQAPDFDRVIVVEAPQAERVRRMMADRGMSQEDAQARLKAQATDAQRRAAATDIIVNDDGLAALVPQVADLYSSLAAQAEAAAPSQ